jgi:hypothetical protein
MSIKVRLFARPGVIRFAVEIMHPPLGEDVGAVHEGGGADQRTVAGQP